ncbi:MAG TPA: helix-turn-helix transcriptional regulator [Candidatus Methylomirabilis sp.]|jgi:transcriptional regulator with XRE-family HTH domain|nr:helix-turn-helix transcriptional regulator [Candidatus Methylomirabilis sp.]
MARPLLPAAPLHRVLRRLRAAESLTWEELAAQAGVTPRHLFRLLAAERISEGVADRIACRLGLHPVLLWPTEWLRTDAEGRCGGADSEAV